MLTIQIAPEAFELLKNELAAHIQKTITDCLKSKLDHDDDEWISWDEARKIIPYRSRTRWQELRDNGDVVFSNLGRKILYSRKSLVKYIGTHEVCNN